MYLLLDAGNTRLKCAIANSDQQIIETAVIDYVHLDNSLDQLCSQHSLISVAVSSVAGDTRNTQIIECCAKLFSLSPMFAAVTQSACGLSNHYRTQQTLGVDRWVAAIGLSAKVGVNRVIVDAGTAVTVDLLDASNAYRGGVILPGAKLMHDSLVGETAGIYSEPTSVDSAIGETTSECVNAGAKFGLVGAVDRVIDEFSREIGDNAPWQISICGGDGEWLCNLMASPHPKILAPQLIFRGLLNMIESGAPK